MEGNEKEISAWLTYDLLIRTVMEKPEKIAINCYFGYYDGYYYIILDY